LVECGRLGHVIGGAVSYRRDSDSAPYGAGDAFLAAQPDRPFHAEIDNADIEYAVLDPGLLTQVATAAPARRHPQPFRFTAYQPSTPRDTMLWLCTYRFVREILTTAPAGQPLVTGAAMRMLGAAALAAFPNNARTEPAAGDSREATPAALRRALGFIDDNAHRDIAPADIAAAAHVSLRALQLALQRHLGCTPTAHLRGVRLERAHRQLLTADPARETVTAIAYRWGFLSSSRFAGYYRQAYGTVPSETLRH
jgi:AraC-like DNA-binding protein